MSSGQQVRDRRSKREENEPPPPPRGRARSGSLLTPKRIAYIALTLVVLAGMGAFAVKTMKDNEAAPKDGLTLPELARMLDNPMAPDPEIDALKAAAAQAQRAEAVKAARENRPDFDPVKIVKKAPGGAGFDPADFPPGSRPNPGSNKALGQQMAAARGWSAEWGCLEKLWDKESHWNERAMNRSSGAYGIPQSLPGSKMASAGADWQTNPATQIKWGLGYIAGRYKSPCGAWAHSQSVGWY